MKKTIRSLAVCTFTAGIFFSCSSLKTKNGSASKKIMTVAEATAFLKADNQNEGKEIMVTANNRGFFLSAGNAVSLSLSDNNFEGEIHKNQHYEFYASFSNEASEYARAVPDNATVTISGKIRHINGKIQLANCKLIAQN
jgi:hypothetical protein